MHVFDISLTAMSAEEDTFGSDIRVDVQAKVDVGQEFVQQVLREAAQLVAERLRSMPQVIAVNVVD